jgi:hypothetical protein
MIVGIKRYSNKKREKLNLKIKIKISQYYNSKKMSSSLKPTTTTSNSKYTNTSFQDFLKKHQIKSNTNNFALRLMINIFTSGKISPQSMQNIMSKINEFGGTIVALGSTLVSVYTGLKALN